MTKFFTSDTHFGHANVIKYSNRPFKDKSEMDEAMIRNWNAKVKSTDQVYHLGDLAFAQEARIVEVLARLNGEIIFLYGNHDQEVKKSAKIKARFSKIADYLEINVEDDEPGTTFQGRQKIILCHYPMITWNKAHHGAWMFHGHCHHNLKYPFRGRIIDVGVDGRGYDYSPQSYEELKVKMKAVQMPQFLDHHREKE